MKKLILILLCVPLIGFEPKKINIEEEDFIATGNGIYFQGELLNCINCELWNNDKIQEECTFIDGRRNGLSVWYYDEGGYRKGFYKNGVEYGIFSYYNKDHILLRERMFNPDTGQEEYEKYFYPNGQLAMHAFNNPIDEDPDNYQNIECWKEDGKKIDCKLLGF